MVTWNKPTRTFLGCNASYKTARAVILGAPLDATISYRPGTRTASRVMRQESDDCIETYSPYQSKDLTDLHIFDAGDLNLPFGNPARALAIIEAHTERILADGKLPVLIGGEHLVTLGAVRAAARVYPDLCLLQLDAHADLRDTYIGEKLSHATVIRRCWDVLGDGRIYQLGIRSGDREELAFGSDHTVCHYFDLSRVASMIQQVKDKPLYVTIDLDVLDPSVFPGTGTPEAGGVSVQELIEAIISMGSARIVGCDITELSPPLDPSGIATAAALKVLRELLLSFVPR
jgi:agmatinase